ncbi:MAG: hypothetical protein GOVbin4933_53 [Prokaryotic dsDNA virus sp.]|nr:MAG: hypothetical protein GOVbin4933_53 [Prokaryotic dsDNA virus sp.]
MATIDDEKALDKVRECLKAPCEYQHVDLGLFFISYMRDEDSIDDFLWNCDVTWLGSKRPPPVQPEG